MKFNFTLVVLIFSFSFHLSAQTLKGRVVEEKSKEGIPFVTVQLGNNYGVISNDEGYFVLQSQKSTDNASLLFSSMGFESLEIPLTDFENGQEISLKPATYKLDEVILFDKDLTAEEILERFKEKIKENHTLRDAKVQVFARSNDVYSAKNFGIDVKKASFLNRSELKTMNENMNNLGEKVKENPSKSYTERLVDLYVFEDTLVNDYKKALNLINRKKTFDTDDIQNQVFLELLRSLKSENSFKVKTGIIPLGKDISLNEFIEDMEKEQLKVPDTIHNKNTWRSKSYKRRATQFSDDFFTTPKYYDYEFKGVTTAFGEPCYHIQFSPDRRKGKYVGDLYISVEDYGMVSYKYNLAEGKKAMNVNLKFVLGIKANTYMDSGFVIFTKNNENTYYPKYVKQTDGNYAYIARNLKFKENNSNRSKRKQLKLDFELEYELVETLEFVGVEYQPVSSDFINSITIEDYILVDEVEKYDPEYWKDYNIIEATEAIKTYE